MEFNVTGEQTPVLGSEQSVAGNAVESREQGRGGVMSIVKPAAPSLQSDGRSPYQIHDNLRPSMHDRDYARLNEAMERRKKSYNDVNEFSNTFKNCLLKQRAKLTKRSGGTFTKAEILVLAEMLRYNLQAAVQKAPIYRPGRAKPARRLNLSERTVSRAFAKLRSLEMLVVHRYPQGGRDLKRNRGLVTEFATGYLHDVDTALEALGYKLPKPVKKDLADWAAWADGQIPLSIPRQIIPGQMSQQ